MTSQQKDDIVDAVLYALREGCFFPVPYPKSPYQTCDLIQWGAMRNLHRAIAEAHRNTVGQETE